MGHRRAKTETCIARARTRTQRTEQVPMQRQRRATRMHAHSTRNKASDMRHPMVPGLRACSPPAHACA
eukprot:16450190-Heterocapsa_arctica.AAC.1